MYLYQRQIYFPNKPILLTLAKVIFGTKKNIISTPIEVIILKKNMNKFIYFLAISLTLASCSDSETTKSNAVAALDNAEGQLIHSDGLDKTTETSKTSFTNESLIGSWSYKKSVTTVEGEVIELVIPGDWMLKFDGMNCTDIKEGDDAQINPYAVENDSLIFTELRFLSMKIVDASDSLIILGQDEYTVLHFSKM